MNEVAGDAVSEEPQHRSKATPKRPARLKKQKSVRVHMTCLRSTSLPWISNKAGEGADVHSPMAYFSRRGTKTIRSRNDQEELRPMTQTYRRWFLSAIALNVLQDVRR